MERALKIVIFSLAGLAAMFFSFGLGSFVGSKRADFSVKFAEEYHNNFGKQFIAGNGVMGQIIKIDALDDINTLTVKGADNVEKTVLANGKTSVVMQRKNLKLSELDIDDNVVIIGVPQNNGQIEARLIRIMPPFPHLPPPPMPQ